MDLLCHEYGWSMDYVLDQPYSRLKALTLAVRSRQKVTASRWLNIVGLATGGSSEDVTKFLETFDPPAEKSESVVDTDADGDAFIVS